MLCRLAAFACILGLSGCIQTGHGQLDVQVQAFNDTDGPVDVRFLATFDENGESILDVTASAPSGYSSLGEIEGPRGKYHLEAWAFGTHITLGQVTLAAGTTCAVYVRNPDPVSIDCTEA